MPKVEIDKNQALQSGDELELHFRTIGPTWIKAAQIAFIEWRLRNRTDFGIMSYDLTQKSKVIFRVRVY